MPILLGALISLAIAWVRGASPLQLGIIRLRWLPVPLVAFAIQYVAFGRLEEAAAGYAVWLQLASMGVLLVFLLANLRYRSLLVVAAGTALNLLVVTANGGYMPARLADLERIGFPQVAAQIEAQGHFQKTGALDEDTRLPYFGDVIHLPLPGPDRLISLGDVFIAAGVFLFVQEALVGRRRPNRKSELRAPSSEGEANRSSYEPRAL
ncbi:MAG: DUF5317 domain-containing protein [Chloroflexota bacterium]